MVKQRKVSRTFNLIDSLKSNWKFVVIAVIFLFIGLATNGFLGVMSKDISLTVTLFSLIILLAALIGGMGLSYLRKSGEMDLETVGNFVSNMFTGLFSGILTAYLVRISLDPQYKPSIFDYILAIAMALFVLGVGSLVSVHIKQKFKKNK